MLLYYVPESRIVRTVEVFYEATGSFATTGQRVKYMLGRAAGIVSTHTGQIAFSEPRPIHLPSEVMDDFPLRYVDSDIAQHGLIVTRRAIADADTSGQRGLALLKKPGARVVGSITAIQEDPRLVIDRPDIQVKWVSLCMRSASRSVITVSANSKLVARWM